VFGVIETDVPGLSAPAKLEGLGLPPVTLIVKFEAVAVPPLSLTTCLMTVSVAVELTKCAYASVRFPLVPGAPFEMHGVGEPGTRIPESVFLSPLVQLLNVFPDVVVLTDFKRTESVLPPKPGMFTVPLDEAIVTVRFVGGVGEATGLTPQFVLPSHRS
jgi:hypothetical protein